MTNELQSLATDALRAQTNYHAALLLTIERQGAEIAHLKAKLATSEAKSCNRCDVVATARALAGVETVRL